MKRNKFSLSHHRLSSLNQGDLIPLSWYEALPGDTIQMSTSALVRAAPLVAPVMHPVHCRIHHWFVPNRLLWDGWEDFITGGPDGNDATVAPYVNINGAIGAGNLRNHMGVPIGNFTNLHISALPFRAYALIWNEWYRDQDLQAEVGFSKASGADVSTNLTAQKCGWEKDYFTTCRLTEQKGADVAVTIGASPLAGGGEIRASATGLLQFGAVTSDAGTGFLKAGGVDSYYDPNGTMTIDVNDLRESLAIQRYQEARARFGSRYTEYLRYLGVKSSDARLQRPEYLGGGKQTIQFSEVLQTAEGANPVGMMRGHGIAAMRSNRWRRFFEEHGIVMTLMSTKPKTMYMQAMHKKWFRETKEEYHQRELEHIGQQAVLRREIFATDPASTTLFGYQDRYDEYRRMESSVAGEFGDTLKYWHMARDLAAAPTLNASFVASDPTTRVYAAPSSSQLYVMAMHSIQARRMLSSTGTSHIF